MKNSFRAIQKSAERLRQQLSELDTYSRLAVEASLDLVVVHESRQPGSEEQSADDRIAYPIEKLEKQLEMLSALMAGQAENLVPKLRKEKRSTSALREFVRRMAELYRTVTGHDAYAGFAWDADGNRYSGPFMIVVEDALSQFCPDWQYTNHAIGETVRRSLGRR